MNWTPAILIDQERFVVGIYNCSEDLLLVSSKFNYVQSVDELSMNCSLPEVFLLWLTINHRYVEVCDSKVINTEP